MEKYSDDIKQLNVYFIFVLDGDCILERSQTYSVA